MKLRNEIKSQEEKIDRSDLKYEINIYIHDFQKFKRRRYFDNSIFNGISKAEKKTKAIYQKIIQNSIVKLDQYQKQIRRKKSKLLKV